MAVDGEAAGAASPAAGVAQGGVGGVAPPDAFSDGAVASSAAQPSAAERLLAGGAAGALSRFTTAPMDRVKLLFQINAVNTNFTLSTAMCAGKRIVREEGVWQGLTLAHFRTQLQDLRDTSLTSELDLSTLGTPPRVNLGHMGDNVSLS
jgi:hypothetical protein